MRSNPIKSCDCDASLAMTKQIATVVSLPRDDKFCNESCTAKRNNLIKKCAFTLAEVLITLGIIGVVAAITLPILVQNYQKKVTLERLRSTYSIISQAVRNSEVDNGPLETWDIPYSVWGNGTYNAGKQFFEIYLKPYLKYVKECGYLTDECWPKEVKAQNGLKATYRSAETNYTYSVVLSNGVVIGFAPNNRGCMQIYTDINGRSNPNTIGKDNYNIIIVAQRENASNIIKDVSKSGVYFFGSGFDRTKLLNDNSYGCQKTGTYCGQLIFTDGWRMTKDYPW